MRIVVATGRKAEGMVRDAVRTVDGKRVSCSVLTQDLDIAAFSTPQTLKTALERSGGAQCAGCDLILVSGFCKADFSGLENELGIPIRLGPRHAYDLGEVLRVAEEMEFSAHTPAELFLAEKRKEMARYHLTELERGVEGMFTLKGVKIGGGSRMKVCAELVDATRMTAEEIERSIERFMKSGADIVDIGAHIGARPEEVRRTVRAVQSFAPDLPLSLDTFDAELIRAGIETGIDMVLSMNSENLATVGDEVGAHDLAAVIVPDSGAREKTESLRANLERAGERGIKRLIADPVLNPIGSGIAESLYHYYRFRLLDPRTPLFFGVGNVVELIDADSVGVNATLAGIASELNADILFTPEYSAKARGSVRELRVASELMMLAKARRSAPKDLGIDLLILKEKRRKPMSVIHAPGLITAEKKETWELDPKGCFRIALCELEDAGMLTRRILAHHSPSGKQIVGENAEEIMDTILRLNLVSRLDHVSYLSRELTKAELALRLDRSYEQDEALF